MKFLFSYWVFTKINMKRYLIISVWLIGWYQWCRWQGGGRDVSAIATLISSFSLSFSFPSPVVSHNFHQPAIHLLLLSFLPPPSPFYHFFASRESSDEEEIFCLRMFFLLLIFPFSSSFLHLTLAPTLSTPFSPTLRKLWRRKKVFSQDVWPKWAS